VRPKEKSTLTILNVAGHGEPLTVAQAIELTRASVKRLPTAILCRTIIRMMWKLGATSIPPDAFPYLIGSYPMDMSKLKSFLGADYEQVIQYSNAAALMESMKAVASIDFGENHAYAQGANASFPVQTRTEQDSLNDRRKN
jgi:hypothetical protein